MPRLNDAADEEQQDADGDGRVETLCHYQDAVAAEAVSETPASGAANGLGTFWKTHINANCNGELVISRIYRLRTSSS